MLGPLYDYFLSMRLKMKLSTKHVVLCCSNNSRILLTHRLQDEAKTRAGICCRSASVLPMRRCSVCKTQASRQLN